MLTFRDTDKVFELDVNYKMLKNENYIADLAKLSDKKLMFEFAKEINFDEKSLGKESSMDKTRITLHQITWFNGFCS